MARRLLGPHDTLPCVLMYISIKKLHRTSVILLHRRRKGGGAEALPRSAGYHTEIIFLGVGLKTVIKIEIL